MTIPSNISQNAVDFHGLNQLRESAIKPGNEASTLRQVAAQFEALFTTMMLKSMRQASLAEGIFDSNHSKTYREMADQQLAWFTGCHCSAIRWSDKYQCEYALARANV